MDFWYIYICEHVLLDLPTGKGDGHLHPEPLPAQGQGQQEAPSPIRTPPRTPFGEGHSVLGDSWESPEIGGSAWTQSVSCFYISMEVSFLKEEEGILEQLLPTGNKENMAEKGGQGRGGTGLQGRTSSLVPCWQMLEGCLSSSPRKWISTRGESWGRRLLAGGKRRELPFLTILVYGRDTGQLQTRRTLSLGSTRSPQPPQMESDQTTARPRTSSHVSKMI